jgi:hypothetical protein
MIAIPPVQTSKKKTFASSRLSAKLAHKIPHQQPIRSGTCPNPKNVDIFISVAKKSFPFAPSFPSINQNPTNSHPIRNTRISKNVHYSKFAHEKYRRFN